MSVEPAAPGRGIAAASLCRLPLVHLLPAVILALPVAALCALGRFDGLYGQDAYYYFNYAVGPARESLLALRPLPAFFWPPGYPLLVALASLLVGPVPIAGQLVSLLMGALAVIFTGLVAEELRLEITSDLWSAPTRTPRALPPPSLQGKGAGGLGWASLLLALHPQLWQSSAVLMADTTGLAAAALGAWAIARYARLRRGRWLALSAAAFAFAILGRWIYGLAALAAGAFAVTLLLSTGPGAAPAPRRWRHALGAAALALFVLSPLLVSAASGPTAPTVESAPFAGSFHVYSWHPLNAFRREFTTTDGLLQYRLPNGLYYALAPLHRYYFTPLLGALLLPGLWAALTRYRRVLWWLLAWAGGVWAFHAGAPWQNFRFTLAYLPPLAILAAFGLGTVRGWFAPRWRPLLSLVVGFGLALMLVGAVQLTQSFIRRKQADLSTVAAVEARLPPKARLITFNMTFTFQHYTNLDTRELYYLSVADLESLLADNTPTFLLLDAANVETQWAAEPLGATFRWLRDERSLQPIDSFGPFTLWRVN